MHKTVSLREKRLPPTPPKKRPQAKGLIRRSITTMLSQDDYVEAMHPVADPESLMRAKATLPRRRHRYVFPIAVAFIAAFSVAILPLNAPTGLAIGFVAGLICAAQVYVEREAIRTREHIRRRYEQYADDFGDLVQIDEHGLHFFDSEHNHLLYYLPWIAVRSFAFSQDALVVRTTDQADMPVVLPMQLFNDDEHVQLFQRFLALSR